MWTNDINRGFILLSFIILVFHRPARERPSIHSSGERLGLMIRLFSCFSSLRWVGIILVEWGTGRDARKFWGGGSWTGIEPRHPWAQPTRSLRKGWETIHAERQVRDERNEDSTAKWRRRPIGKQQLEPPSERGNREKPWSARETMPGARKGESEPQLHNHTPERQRLILDGRANRKRYLYSVSGRDVPALIEAFEDQTATQREATKKNLRASGDVCASHWSGGITWRRHSAVSQVRPAGGKLKPSHATALPLHQISSKFRFSWSCISGGVNYEIWQG